MFMFSTAKIELTNCTIQLILTSVNRTNAHAPAKNFHLIRNVFIMVSSFLSWPQLSEAVIWRGNNRSNNVWWGGEGDNFRNVAVKFCPTLPLPVSNFWSNLLAVDFTSLEDVYLEILISWVGEEESSLHALQTQSNLLTVQVEIFNHIQNCYLQITRKFQLVR